MLGDGHIHFLAQLLSDRGHFAILEATGVDQVEGRQIGIDIERKAVHRHVATALDSDGADLALLHGVTHVEPDTRSTSLERRVDAEEAQELDDGLLQQVNVRLEPEAELLQIKDRVAGDLPRTVVGDVAPSLDGEEIIAVLTEEVFAHQHVRLICVLAHSEDRIVLAEEEEALRRPPFVLGVELCFEELLLQGPSLSIGDTSKVSIGVGLSVSGEREDTYPGLVHLDIFEVIGGLEICRQEG